MAAARQCLPEQASALAPPPRAKAEFAQALAAKPSATINGKSDQSAKNEAATIRAFQTGWFRQRYHAHHRRDRAASFRVQSACRPPPLAHTFRVVSIAHFVQGIYVASVFALTTKV